MEEMTDSNLSQDKKNIQMDDLRLIFENDSLKQALCSNWPTMLNWEDVKDGENGSVGLHGIAAAIMFLRRMYAFLNGQDLSNGKPTILTQLSWREVPLSNETEPETLQTLFKELGISTNQGKGISLIEILEHDSMANVWGVASMTLRSNKAVNEKEGQASQIVELPFYSESWKDDMIITNASKVLEDRARKYFPKRSSDSGESGQLLCNFPTFLKVHYQPCKISRPNSFSDIRSFRLRGPVLANGAEVVEEGHIYVLIACYFNPDKEAKAGELRLYSDRGVPILPRNGLPPEWQDFGDFDSRRILGDRHLDVVLLYGKTDSKKEDPDCSELPLDCVEHTNPSLCGGRIYVERFIKEARDSRRSTVPQTQLEQTSATPLVHEAVPRQPTDRLTSDPRSGPGSVPGRPDSEFFLSQTERATSQLPRAFEPTQMDNRKRPYSGSHYGAPSGHRSRRRKGDYDDEANSQGERSTRPGPSTEPSNAGQPQVQRQRGPYDPLDSQEAAYNAFMQSQGQRNTKQRGHTK